jgi:hypothetical protein
MLAVVLILILAAVVVGWYDRYSVQRTYADLYAARYGQIPPLIDWFFEPDSDAEVDEWRRLHRNMYLLVTGLGAAAVIAALTLGSISG